MSVIGQPVLALAQRPEVGVVLRPASGGHRGAIAEAFRDATSEALGAIITIADEGVAAGPAA